jgi:adenosylhomocysteine nucleosidase
MRKIILLLCLAGAVYPSQAQSPIQPISVQADARKYNNITGILGAFSDEVKIILANVQQKKEHIIQQIRFTEGTLNGRHVVVAQTGIGKVNAAITSTLLVEHFMPRELIFTGIAGGINPELSPGDLVIGTTVAHHDYGTINPDGMLLRSTRNPFNMQENPVYFPCDASLVQLAEQTSKKITLEKIGGSEGKSPRISSGVIVTGDVFVSSSTATLVLRKQMNAEATEMEGASVGQVCWQQRVPFIVIRSLSDDAGNNAHTDVKAFYQLAAKNSSNLVMAMAEALAKK